jgi:hypothetical protein
MLTICASLNDRKLVSSSSLYWGRGDLRVMPGFNFLQGLASLDRLEVTGGSCVFLPLACLRFLCSDLRLYYVSIYFL